MRHVLPAEPNSVSLARQFVTDTLAGWGDREAIETASLLVSEVVTNAVLHAGSAVELIVRAEPDRARVEVGDSSPQAPHRRAYAAEATTGRGLELVELLAERWGVDMHHPEGKVVWFEIAAAGRPPHEGPPEGQAVQGGTTSSPPVGAVAVQLLQAPVRLMATMQQHTETLLRELALVSVEAAEEWTPIAVGVDFDELDHQLRGAMRAGDKTADLVVHLLGHSAAMVRAAGDALRHGDHLASEGWLLCPPALPEVADCRRWFLDQLADQLEGRPAEPWYPQPGGMVEGIPQVDHAGVLDHLAHAVVVANDENRIVYLNAAGEALLGWSAEELVGQRLTTIIPERLHHAHIAGYTRYLLTGQPRLLNTPVRVPAQRRDGSEADVELALSAFRSEAGRQMFAAVLHTAGPNRASWGRGEQASSDARTERADIQPHEGLLDRVRSLLVDSEGQAIRDLQRILATLATELGWQFAAWWTPEGDTLRCAATWQGGRDMEAFVAATAERRFAAGDGLPGRVWARGAPVWSADLVADANFPRAALAVAAGLRSGCAFPITSNGRVEGVVELLADASSPPDEALMRSLAAVGEMLGTAT